MNDSELIRIAKRIDGLNEQIRDLLDQISESERPDANDIVEALDSNGFVNFALAQAVVSGYVSGKYYGTAFRGHIFSRKEAARMDLELDGQCGQFKTS